MNPDAATFWTGIGCLLLGWVAFWLLVHRPDRAVRAIEHAAEIDAFETEIDGLYEELERAEEGRNNAETEAATYLRKLGEEAAARVVAEVAADDLRAEMLPDLNYYLDTVANLPVGFRLDMGAFDSETPIGLSVVESLADVVPLRGGRA